MPKELPILVVKKKDQSNNNKNFIVNRHRVESCLRFLCKNNPLFIACGVKIDETNLSLLPVNDIPQEINELIEKESTNDNNDNTGNDIGPELKENTDEFELEVFLFVQ